MLVKIIELILTDWDYAEKVLMEENFEPGNMPLKGDILYNGGKCYKVEERRIYLSNNADKQYFELMVKFKDYV